MDADQTSQRTVRAPLLYRSVLVLFFALSVISIPSYGLLEAGQASWGCDPGFFQVISGQMAKLDPTTGSYQPIGPDQANYNAIAYRPTDGLIYGMRSSELLVIDNTGVPVTRHNFALGKGLFTGDFGDDGYLYASDGGRTWWRFDVDALTKERLGGMDQPKSVNDVANVHGILYGVSSDNFLIRFDPALQTSVNVGKVAGLPSSTGAFGAAWSTAGGNLYVGRNSGEMYQITGYSTSSPQATNLGTAQATNSNDGASCAYAFPPPGIPDVDGPEPETEPSTPEAQVATSDYIDAVTTGAIVVDPNLVDPVGTVEGGTTTTVPGDNFETTDAALGEGASCPTTPDQDRLPRMTVTPESVEEDTVVYSQDFNDGGNSAFLPLAGSWSVSNGELQQLNDCGHDYVALLQASPLENYRLSATFRGIDGPANAGVVLGYSSEHTRSGSWLVDLTEDGSVVRWGTYDNAGYFQYVGSTAITAPAPNEYVNLTVTAADGTIIVVYNGTELARVPGTAIGHVGATTSLTKAGFTELTLTALAPAPPEGTTTVPTTTPPESTTTSSG